MSSSLWKISKDAMKSFSTFPISNNWKNGEAFLKHNIDWECNEDIPFKGMQKYVHVKLGLSHLSKVTPHECSIVELQFQAFSQTKTSFPKP
jgi:hypothetical protein